jgi:hypothetical protein
MANIKFWLDGCDISFLAEAPEDITLKELLVLCDRIEPDYCACGIKSFIESQRRFETVELVFTKEDVKKAQKYVSCKIHENDEWYKQKYSD